MLSVEVGAEEAAAGLGSEVSTFTVVGAAGITVDKRDVTSNPRLDRSESSPEFDEDATAGAAVVEAESVTSGVDAVIIPLGPKVMAASDVVGLPESDVVAVAASGVVAVVESDIVAAAVSGVVAEVGSDAVAVVESDVVTAPTSAAAAESDVAAVVESEGVAAEPEVDAAAESAVVVAAEPEVSPVVDNVGVGS